MGDGGASTLPVDNAGYLRAEYWDARFEHEAEYEWFRRRALQCADSLAAAVQPPRLVHRQA